MSKVRYNRELLDACMERDGATLVGEYLYVNCKTDIKFICSCGKDGNKNLKNISNNGGSFCLICTKNKKKDKVKATTLKNYGVENPSQNKDIKQKKKETLLLNYGVENPMYSDKLKEKLKEVFIEKYGVDNPSKCYEIKEKKKETSLINYGVEFPTSLKEIKDKVKATNLKKFGVEYSLQSEYIKDKSKATNIKKYGVKHPMQNSYFSEKVLSKSYSTKDYILPSGNIIKVQGYEPFALDKIVKEWNIEEDNIITDRTKVPEIWWNDSNDIRRRYYVDIFIPSKNLIIEVKSTWTITLDIENIKRKIQAVRALEYNTLLWVFGEKGNIVKEYYNCPIEV